MGKPATRLTSEEFQERLNSFHQKIEQTVIMANILSQELAMGGAEMQDVVAKLGLKDVNDVREKLQSLSELADQISEFTGKTEIEISRFLSEANGESTG